MQEVRTVFTKRRAGAFHRTLSLECCASPQ